MPIAGDQPRQARGSLPPVRPLLLCLRAPFFPSAALRLLASGHGRVAELVEIDVAADTVSPEPASTSLLSPSALQNCYCQFTEIRRIGVARQRSRPNAMPLSPVRPDPIPSRSDKPGSLPSTTAHSWRRPTASEAIRPAHTDHAQRARLNGRWRRPQVQDTLPPGGRGRAARG